MGLCPAVEGLDTATAFNNGFTPGIMAFNAMFDDRMTYAASIFRNSYDVYGFSIGAGQAVGTYRLTWLPWYADEGKYLMHLGASLSDRAPVDGQNRYRIRTPALAPPAPLTPFVPILIDTDFFGTSSTTIMNLEYFMNLGPVTVQAEYMGTWNGNTTTAALGNVGTTYFQGAYGQVLYWLTGEYTHWDKKAAAPDRYNVVNPFFMLPGRGCYGTGAWQLCARASWINLNSQGFNSGIIDDLTFGVNWILNNNTKFQFNYDVEHRTGLGLGGGSNGSLAPSAAPRLRAARPPPVAPLPSAWAVWPANRLRLRVILHAPWHEQKCSCVSRRAREEMLVPRGQGLLTPCSIAAARSPCGPMVLNTVASVPGARTPRRACR
jgi:hypothetical protein